LVWVLGSLGDIVVQLSQTTGKISEGSLVTMFCGLKAHQVLVVEVTL